MTTPSDLSFDSALSALDNVSSKAPAAAPEDREGVIDDIEDEENEAGAGEEAEGAADEDNVDADSSDADDEGEADPNLEATDDAETEGDEAEQDKAPAIEPPTGLDEKQREVFKKLPREMQQAVVDHDRALVADHTRKTQEIAEKRKALDTRLAALREVKTEKQKRIEKWQKVDWADMATKLTPQEYNRNRALMDKELGEYRALETKLQREEESDYRSHVVAESAALKALAPELHGDSKEAIARRTEVMQAAVKAGFDRERLRWMNAKEMNFVWKAIQWDKYQAEKAKKPNITARKNEKSNGRVIKPASRTNAPTGVKGVVSKTFKSKPTQANAMSLLNALDD